MILPNLLGGRRDVTGPVRSGKPARVCVAMHLVAGTLPYTPLSHERI